MKKLQFAMVGGGTGALIGDIHRIGAQFDDLAELKAGCFSRHWDKNLEAGEKWGVEPGRIYPDYHTMLEEEAKRTGEDRLDFVVVATPNNTHYEIVKDIIAHGFHSVCDKPVTFTSRESEELKALAQEKDLLFGVSYSYAHYAILEQAKKMIADGVLGKIHTIAAEYPQEWVGLNTALRGKDGLTWRVDPAICGPSGVIADIGTHVEYLISKVTGLKPVRVLARLRSIPDYVPVESDAQVLIDYDNGAAGIFWTSFAMVGKSCCMKVRIYGDKGGMEWNAHDFMELRVDIAGQPTQIWSANYDYCDPQARKSCRLPKGMPEAFHSLFANFYRGYCSHLLSRKEGKDERPFPYSDIDDGIQGLKFIEACLKSQEDGNVWTQV